MHLQEMMTKLLLVVIATGVTIDFCSCLLFIRRNQTGSGPSGLPLVTLIVCYLLALLLSQHAVLTSFLWLDGLILLCFHIIVVFVIPMLHRKWVTYKSE